MSAAAGVPATRSAFDGGDESKIAGPEERTASSTAASSAVAGAGAAAGAASDAAASLLLSVFVVGAGGGLGAGGLVIMRSLRRTARGAEARTPAAASAGRPSRRPPGVGPLLCSSRSSASVP